MAKHKKRAVPADLWIQRATAAQMEKMKTALGLSDHITRTVKELEEDGPPAPRPLNVPLHPVPVMDLALPDGQRSVLWDVHDVDIETAYVCERVKSKVDGGVPAYRLLKVRIERGVVIHIEAGVENMRGVVLQDIEDHLLRDA